MLVGISGGRGDGTPWPDVGGELDVSDDEGAQLCASGLAAPVAQDAPVETAVPPVADVEVRAGDAPEPNPGPEVLIPVPDEEPDAEDA